MTWLIFIPYIGPLIGLFLGPYVLIKEAKIFDFAIIMIFSRLANPVLYSHFSGYGGVWWISLYLSLGLFFLKKVNTVKLKRNNLSVFFVFVCLAFLISSFSSINIGLSLLKVINWSTIVLLLICVSSELNYSMSSLKSNLMVVILLSLLTIPFSSISYARDGLGFQGILNHPQSFAVFISVLTAHCIFEFKGKGRVLFVLIVVFLLYLTRARTGFLILFSIVIPYFALPGWYLITLRWSKVIQKSKGFFVSLIALIVLSLTGYTILGEDKVRSFLFKAEENTTISEALEDSRGFIVSQQWENFKKNKIFGIGFGIADSETHAQEVETFNGIPVSASTEKANLLLAVIEESGILGGLIFFPFLILLTIEMREESIFWLAILLSNLSEVTFFSIGSFGLLAAILISKRVNKI